MDGLIDIDSARALVSDASLWPRVRDFLWNFASQIHPTWFDRLTVGPCDRWFQETVQQSNDPTVKRSNDQTVKRLPPRLSRWLLSELKVEPCFHPFPSTDSSRLLLLDSATLVSIAHWLGALASADALRRVTRGPDVASLKSALPGVYPAVFSYTAYFSKSSLPSSSDPAPSALQSLGFSLLHATLAHLPPPLLHRLRLKLPATISEQSFRPPAAVSNDSTVKRSNGQTVKLLLKLRFPEAFSLCFS